MLRKQHWVAMLQRCLPRSILYVLLASFIMTIVSARRLIIMINPLGIERSKTRYCIIWEKQQELMRVSAGVH